MQGIAGIFTAHADEYWAWQHGTTNNGTALIQPHSLFILNLQTKTESRFLKFPQTQTNLLVWLIVHHLHSIKLLLNVWLKCEYNGSLRRLTFKKLNLEWLCFREYCELGFLINESYCASYSLQASLITSQAFVVKDALHIQGASCDPYLCGLQWDT